MKSNFLLNQELEAKNKEYYGKDDFLSVDILTIANKIDAARATMFANMCQQAVCINNAEPPKVFTRYENNVGKYSSSYYQTPNPIKVIKKIKKFEDNDNYYTLITYDTKKKEYGIIERKVGEKLTENYCYLYNNEVIDTLEDGDEIEEGTLLYHSTNFDEYKNYSYGLNAKVAFISNSYTIEDAMEVSESFAKRMSFNYMYSVETNVNTNDLLLNIYGDSDDYKSFPDINEETNGKVLTSKKRINYKNALFDLKDEQLRLINYANDTVYYAEGKVIDVDIYCNVDLEELTGNAYNVQLIRYIKNQNRYFKEIYDEMNKIMKSKKKCTYSDDFKYMYGRARDIVDPEKVWKNDKNEFDHILLKIKVLKENPLHVGSKLAGRYG